ncbi:hypothetical protein GCM10027020_14670 [Nocardioides salsibiostraticola]
MSDGVDLDLDSDDRSFEVRGSEEIPTTGVAELDAVIASVAALGDDRVEDHVVVLESAQVALRQALDQPRAAH